MGDDSTADASEPQDDSEQPATGATGDSEATPKRTRRPRGNPHLNDRTGWRIPTPPRIVEQRVATVARAIIDGMGRAAILQATAKAQAEEAKKRDAARSAALRAGVPKDDAELEAKKLVPVLWGDDAPAQRTIELYIKRAKEAIGDEGKNLSRHREYVLGMQLARCNEVYSAAFRAGRYSTCLQVIREVNEMFGMHEAIKVLLLGNPDGSKVDPNESSANMRSDEGRARMMSSLMQKAASSDPQLAAVIGRFAQIAASAKLSEVDPTTTSAPVQTVDAPAKPSNGHKGNGNGRNGKH